MDKKRPSVGIMVGGVHASFPRELIRGIHDKVMQEDMNAFFFLRLHTKPFFRDILGETNTYPYDYQFNTLFDYSKISGLDGIIIGYGTIGLHMENILAEDFLRRHNDIPLVVLTEQADLPNCSSIICDNRQGMADLTRHLIEEHGCKKILFMKGPKNNTDASERLAGYLETMQAYGLPVTEEMMGQGNFTSNVEREVERLLDANPDAQALMFANDEMAVSGYRVFAARGIQVGKDLLVTGYDCADISEKVVPPLTTVFQDAYGMAIRSVEDMMGLLNGEQPSGERYPTELVIRESCGCTAKTTGETEAAPDYEAELERLRADAAHREQEYMRYQGKSWFIPMLARDLNEGIGDEREFCRVVMEKMQQLSAKAAYLFLLDEPIPYDGTSEWSCPENLALASSFRKGRIESFALNDRIRVSGSNGIAQITDDGEKHQYMVYLLFSADRQYGLLVCDVPMEDLSFFYVVSLQIGLSMRHFELSRQEALWRSQVTRDMELVRAQNRELGMISGYDELTQMLNRRGMKEQVQRLCDRGDYLNAYVVYCDMDQLKQINDTYGHQEGNDAIQASADILRRCVRGSDFLARFGGDEFVCLVSSSDEMFPEVFPERVERACALWNLKSGKPYKVDISLGVAPVELRDYTDFENACKVADHRMYENKKLRKKLTDRDY